MRAWTMLLAAALFAAAAGAAQRYSVLEDPQPTVDPARIEVRELFAYFCPHCHALEPVITAWRDRQGEDVRFVRQPAVFDPRWEPQARAYFVIEALELGETVHRALFDAIHRQGRPLATREELAAFFAEQGVKKEDFEAAYDSPGVEFKLRDARERTRAYRASGVPTLVVDGKYVTSVSQAGSQEALLAVLDELVARQRASRSP